MPNWIFLDSWPKILLFRTHHLWNSTTELMLIFILNFLSNTHNLKKNLPPEELYRHFQNPNVYCNSLFYKLETGRIQEKHLYRGIIVIGNLDLQCMVNGTHIHSRKSFVPCVFRYCKANPLTRAVHLVMGKKCLTLQYPPSLLYVRQGRQIR